MMSSTQLRRFTRLFAALLVLPLALLACAEREMYHRALEAGTIGAFREYIETYPEGDYIDEAYDCVEEIYFRTRLAKGTPEGVDEYLREFPRGRFVKAAENARAKAEANARKARKAWSVNADAAALTKGHAKATTKYNDLFASQTLTYLRLMTLRLGVVINFGEKRVVDGFHRVANGL